MFFIYIAGHIVKLEMASNFTRILNNEVSPNSSCSCGASTEAFPDRMLFVPRFPKLAIAGCAVVLENSNGTHDLVWCENPTWYSG